VISKTTKGSRALRIILQGRLLPRARRQCFGNAVESGFEAIEINWFGQKG
jgi:hypothetical protein